MTDTKQSSPAYDAIFEAQKLAFAPVAFQVAKVLRDRGVLAALAKAGNRGMSVAALQEATGTSTYGLDTLLEAGLSFGLVTQRDDTYVITRTGFFIDRDPMTRVNMDFIHDVCYQGFFALDQAIEQGKPAGLGVFGKWDTIYEGLSKLPDHVKQSWFAFDHFYSDGAFPQVLPIVFADKPKKLMDVGGNTGKFALQCCAHDPTVQVTICDLPGQLDVALSNAAGKGLQNRIAGHPINLLDMSQPLPKGFDAIWMSQFLCCFSMEEIVSILRRAREAMDEHTVLWIMDTYWDRQENEVASYCLHGTSLYFTAMANGTSRMYSAEHMLQCVAEAGLKVEKTVDHLGLSHTLFRCRR